MSTNEKRLPPASFATDGEQAQSTAAYRSCEQEHTPILAYWRYRAFRLVAQARHALDQYANLTDKPAPSIVDAADLLALAAEALADSRAGGSVP